MNIRNSSILLVPLLIAGCATPPPVVVKTLAPTAVVAVASPTKPVETRYEVRGYREAANPSIRHEAHVVYRRTRVPVAASDDLGTVSRESCPPVNVSPLPASEELTAELATQKKITAELHAMQASIAETEQSMQAQYALLVRQGAEVLKVKGQLEAERSRLRSVPSVEAAPAAPVAATTAKEEPKW